MSTTTEGIPEQSDWARPAGCHCFTWRQHEQCYENCDPVEPKPKRRGLGPVAVAAILALVVGLAHLFLISTARPADLAFAAWRLPNYCDGLKLMERSCTSVKAVARVYGRTGAERRARICGATDSDIAQANACFEEKK